MHPPHFQVAVVDETTVQLRWLRPLEYKDALSLVLEQELAALDAVESVEFNRYSATLTVAKHVQRAPAVADALFALFAERNEITFELDRAYPGEWKVLLVPYDAVRFGA
jgi:hypothetical protein